MRLKKVKNAGTMVQASDYVVQNPNTLKGAWKQFFENKNPICIEIGCGKGQFIIEMAKRHPDMNFIGIEMQDSVLVRALQKLELLEEPPHNLRFLQLDASNIADVFEKEIGCIYFNFSDPWPKKRHAKRRLTSQNFLEKYENIFEKEKKICLKTDNQNLFDFSIASLTEAGYQLCNISRDYNSAENIQTEYEEKFRKQGIKINYLEGYKN